MSRVLAAVAGFAFGLAVIALVVAEDVNEHVIAITALVLVGSTFGSLILERVLLRRAARAYSVHTHRLSREQLDEQLAARRDRNR